MEPHKDIVRMGHLRRLKTMKKKWFVLWQDGEVGPARLEYYDTEKKFRNGIPRKRGIEIATCFNINKKSDTKQKHAIALFTKEDCFAVVCESQEEQQAWLTALLQLWTYNQEANASSRPLFEHIWQVIVKSKGLASSAGIPTGAYRLCLTNNSLSLIRLHQEEAEVSFQLASIRRCGHSDCFFFMEVGRMAATGQGELWMQVEDTVIAHNMHDVILSSMRASNATAEQPSSFRPRSRSSAAEKSRPAGSGRSGPPYDSATLPKRSKTISEPHGSSPMRNAKSHSRHSGFRPSSSISRYSPVGATSPLSQTMLESDLEHRLRTDSMESRGSHGTASSSISAEDCEDQFPSGSTSTRSVTPEGPFVVENNPDYLAMSPIAKGTSLSPGLEVPHAPGSGGYVEMNMSPSLHSDTSGDIAGYMDMTPGQHMPDPYMDMSRASYSASPAPSSASSHSNLDTEDKGYLDMTPVARSLPTVQEKMALDPYMATTPEGHSPRTGLLRPDKVYSFLADDDYRLDEFPKRAYSVGSKPVVVRTMDKNNKDENVSQMEAGTSKSSSAPHLPDEFTEKAPTSKGENARKGKEENDGHFMEMDFMRPRTDSTSSFGSSSSLRGIKDIRSRTSSLGQQDFRPRTSSAGNIVRNTSANAGKGEKVWISKEKASPVNQDPMRPRTSSCGQDYRPRAASWGNSKHRKHGKNAASQESLTKTLFNSIRRKSQELGKGHSKAGYMDMTNPTSSARPSLESHTESSYVDMAPQIVTEAVSTGNKASEMVGVRIGSPVLSSTPEKKRKEGYMEMQPVKGTESSVAYANISYGSGNVRRSSGYKEHSSLVEEEEPVQTDHRSLPVPMETDESVPAERGAQFCIGGITESEIPTAESHGAGSLWISQQGALHTDYAQLTGTRDNVHIPSVSKPLPVPSVVKSIPENKSDPTSSKTVDTEGYMTLSFDANKSSNESSKKKNFAGGDSKTPPRHMEKGTKDSQASSKDSGGKNQLSVRYEKGNLNSMDTSARGDEKRRSPKSPLTVNTDLFGMAGSSTATVQKRKSPKTPESINMDPFAMGISPVKLRDSTSPVAKTAKTGDGVSVSRKASTGSVGEKGVTQDKHDKPAKRTPGSMLQVSEKGAIGRKLSSSSLPGSVDHRTNSTISDQDSSGSSNRHSLQDSSGFSDAGPGISRNSSKTSLNSEKELNYIDVHHMASDEAAQLNRSRHSSSKTSLSMASNEEEDSPLFYAEIDFAKSEELKRSASAKDMKEARFPPR